MSNEIQAVYTTGKTLYAVLLSATPTVWNGAAFETPAAANWATYPITLTEISTVGVYAGTMPVVAAGDYTVAIYEQTGASPAATDPLRLLGTIGWHGTSVLPVDPLQNAVPGTYAAGTAGAALGAIGTGTTTITTPIIGTVLTLTIGTSFAATVTGLTISASWTQLDFSLKNSVDAADSAAILRVRVSNPAAALTDGALIVGGGAAAATQRTLASLTVNQAVGSVALALTPALTAALSPSAALVWDLKEFTATTQDIRGTGTAIVQRAVTWAIV